MNRRDIAKLHTLKARYFDELKSLNEKYIQAGYDDSSHERDVLKNELKLQVVTDLIHALRETD